ncbi:hypothetical protein Tco_0240780 [Tanacetum coccineum]
MVIVSNITLRDIQTEVSPDLQNFYHGPINSGTGQGVRDPKQRFEEAPHAYPKRGLGTDNQEKDEKQSQNDKTGLGMEKTVKDKPNQSRKVNQVKKSTEKSTGQSQSQPKSTPRPKSKKYKFRD